MAISDGVLLLTYDQILSSDEIYIYILMMFGKDRTSSFLTLHCIYLVGIFAAIANVITIVIHVIIVPSKSTSYPFYSSKDVKGIDHTLVKNNDCNGHRTIDDRKIDKGSAFIIKPC
jgi:hypothetical protein